MQLWLFLLVVPTVLAEGFTFPTSDEYEFIVGDLVNVTWNVVTARFSLYEVCDTAVVLECEYPSITKYYLYPSDND
jgi:hypothetical protein